MKIWKTSGKSCFVTTNYNCTIEVQSNDKYVTLEDAKLIAAAPFMLKMLKEIAEGVGNGCHREDIFYRANKAIEKAVK